MQAFKNKENVLFLCSIVWNFSFNYYRRSWLFWNKDLVKSLIGKVKKD